MKVKIRNVRLAFPHLFTPVRVNNEGKPAYSAAFLFSPDHPDVARVIEIEDRVASEKWEAKASATLKALRANHKAAIKSGNIKADCDGYAGMWFINARNDKKRPEVRDRDTSPLRETDGRPYAGCYVDAILDIWAQDNSWGKRINASLIGVQFRKDGEPFACGAKALESDFETLEEDLDEDPDEVEVF